jgi:acyl-CoA synthetase (AMP-forming)/AMP-acid ligase II
MPTIRQLIQTSPAKANELFAKLAETSGNAVKTRERLFAELKEELELQMRLEEQHLFPVLRKRKETKDLVPDSLNNNKETRKALSELERIPKESEAFASKVAELRKAFQQHVRDDRKELLPAVLKALDGRLAKFKMPKRVFVVDELPRNTMGKVQKNVLRDTYKDIYAKK